ncbi:hypothetical protein ACHAO7_011842 [Fusarium culmorum]
MQKPIPREWLLSHSCLQEFAPDRIEEALSTIRPDNFRMVIVSQKYPGNWDQKEKWYGTEYRHEKIPDDLMGEFKKAATVYPEERFSALHLPDKNLFIPNNLEVEKKEVDEPALNPRVLSNDNIARTWWKKDDIFWVPRANVIVSLKTPLIYASAENNVKARLFADLVRDTLEEYAYDAYLAGLQYNVSLDSRGLFLDVSGYNDKLPVLLEQVVTAIWDLYIKEDRFEIVRERLNKRYNNSQLQSSYHQVGDYANWLNAPERHFIVEELADELSSVTLEGVRLFQKQMLGQVFIEVYVHGNMYKEDALKATDIVASTLKPRVLPQAQWPVLRSLIPTKGSNHVFRKTLMDPANVNHCVETWFYVGSGEDREVRTKTLLLEQMFREPAFDQLRTKEQLGYIVFSGPRAFSTTYGFRLLIQSEMAPEFLDSRIEAFLMRYVDTLEKMSDTESEGHKRSVIVGRLEKLMNLDQESTRHWSQITKEYYDFELHQRDATQIKLLTKPELEEAQKKADEEPSAMDAVKNAQEITDVRLYKAGLTASSGARPVKDISEYADTDAKL